MTHHGDIPAKNGFLKLLYTDNGLKLPSQFIGRNLDCYHFYTNDFTHLSLDIGIDPYLKISLIEIRQRISYVHTGVYVHDTNPEKPMTIKLKIDKR